jgi:hypothetical protein
MTDSRSLRRAVSLAAPAPSDAAHATRVCRRCARPRPQVRAQTAPSFTELLRQPGGGVFQRARSGSASWRTTSDSMSSCSTPSDVDAERQQPFLRRRRARRAPPAHARAAHPRAPGRTRPARQLRLPWSSCPRWTGSAPITVANATGDPRGRRELRHRRCRRGELRAPRRLIRHAVAASAERPAAVQPARAGAGPVEFRSRASPSLCARRLRAPASAPGPHGARGRRR